MTHWAEKYLGKAWQSGAIGQDAYDCWSLVRCIYRDEYGIDLPIMNVNAGSLLEIRRAFATTDEYQHWTPIDYTQMSDGDVVLMSMATDPHHVGIWIAGKMLHAVEGAGVVYQSRQSLYQHGWNIVEIYRRGAC